MLCLSETVITFHRTAKIVVIPKSNQTTCQELKKPITISNIGIISKVKNSEGPLPIFFAIFGP